MEEGHETKKKDASIIMNELHPQPVLKGMAMLVAHVSELITSQVLKIVDGCSRRRRKNAEQITIRRRENQPPPQASTLPKGGVGYERNFYNTPPKIVPTPTGGPGQKSTPQEGSEYFD